MFGHRTCPQPPAGPSLASQGPQAIPRGHVFYDLPLTNVISPLQLQDSQRPPCAFSIANINTLEAVAGTTRAAKRWGKHFGLTRSQERDLLSAPVPNRAQSLVAGGKAEAPNSLPARQGRKNGSKC